MLGLFAAEGLSLPKLLAITIPSTFIAVLIGALSVAWRGKTLEDDAEYQERLAKGVVITAAAEPLMTMSIRNAHGSMLLFLAGIVVVVLLGIFPAFHETGSDGFVDTDQVSMGMD